MSGMRTVCIVLFALLLPLRLMASDAMAVHMMHSGAPQAAQAAQPAAASSHAGIDMHADCAGQTVSGDAGDTLIDPNAHCPTCSHCQACAAVVMAVNLDAPLVALAPGAPPAMPAPAFSSAELAPGHKPPIS